MDTLNNLVDTNNTKLNNYKVIKSIEKYKKYFILGPLFKVVEACFDLIIPLIMKNVLDVISTGELISNEAKLKYVLFGGGIILLLGILGFSSTMVCQYMASVACMKVGNDVRNNLFKKIGLFSSKEIEQYSTSYLHTVINTDTVYVQTGVSMFIRLAFRAPLLIIGALIISFIYSYKIALVFLGIIPLICVIIFVFMRMAAKKYEKIQASIDSITTRSTDALSGNRVIRAFNRQEYEKLKFDNENNNYLSLGKTVSIINSFINPMTFAIINIVIIFIVYFFAFDMSQTVNVLDSSLQATTIIALVNYLEQIFQALLVVTNLINIFTRSITSSKRINKIFSTEISVKTSSKNFIKDIKDGDELFSFDNVSLSYEDSANLVLKDISFKLNKGESLGIIGGTGSGKTSIINLLMRFVDASKGKVLYKGVDIKDYSLVELRNEIGLVMQKSVLFKGTIRSNLTMGNSDATDEDIKKALENSLALEFVSRYPDFIDHEVNEKGSNFSGGQRQRLAIARTLVKKNQVLILDDSTSALDYLSDLNVRKNIRTNYSDLTRIYISQRVSTVSECDKILVINEGKLVGMGTHNDLIKNNVVYREIYLSQQKGVDHE